VAEAKGAGELALEDEDVGEIAEWTEWGFVVDVIVKKGAGGELVGMLGAEDAGFGADAVAVLPGGKRAAVLDIAELLVPEEVDDLGVPGNADGRKGDGAEAEGEAGAGAGDDGSARQLHTGGRGWGRGEGGFFDAGLLPGGHEAREVFRIGEEAEDELNWMGKPLFGVKGVAHTE